MAAAAAANLSALKAAVASGDVAKATTLLGGLKVALTAFASLPPLLEPSPSAAAELALARDVFEQAVLLSVKARDDAAFERNFAQLKPYYTDARHLLPASPAEHGMTGLNLMRLLVQNRTAEFHTELELLSAEAHASAHVKHAVGLEQYIMEGAYNKVLEARSAVPDASYAWFMEALAETVRDEIGACAEAAYGTLSLKAAQTLLRLDTPAQTAAFVAKRGWPVRGDVIDFAAMTPAPDAAIPAPQLISNTLAYARELERII